MLSKFDLSKLYYIKTIYKIKFSSEAFFINQTMLVLMLKEKYYQGTMKMQRRIGNVSFEKLDVNS